MPLFVTWMREQFESEGDFGGERWEQLSPAYLAWKSVHYPGKGILVATGDLRKAASLPKREVTPTTLTLIVDDSAYTHGGKTARSVAGYHQEGTDSMPRRPLIFEHFPAVAEAEVERAAERYIAETVHRLGLRTGGAG